MAVAENLSVIGVSGTLWSALIDEVKWLRKTLISLPGNFERCKLSDAEAVLSESQVFKFMFACFALKFSLKVRLVDNVKELFYLKT